MKFIREGRFGPPKCWKTGSVLDTYPTPIGHINWDQGGYEITKRKHTVVDLPEWQAICRGDRSPPSDITVLDCSFRVEQALTTTYTPVPEEGTFNKTVHGINALHDSAKAGKLPFKTVVGDPITELSNSIYRHQAKLNTASLADPRKWAGNIGAKVQQTIWYLTALPCNVVIIFHTEVQKDELTGKITELPMVYSNLRNYLGGMFTQFFYQSSFGKDVKIRTKAFENVNGIGARWPSFDREMVDPTFKGIYGGEKDVYQ